MGKIQFKVNPINCKLYNMQNGAKNRTQYMLCSVDFYEIILGHRRKLYFNNKCE